MELSGTLAPSATSMLFLGTEIRLATDWDLFASWFVDLALMKKLRLSLAFSQMKLLFAWDVHCPSGVVFSYFSKG